MRSHASTTDDGVGYRDLNHNGRLDPYEDPRLTPEERTADLLSQLSLAEKVGLMFHTIIESGPGGTLVEEGGRMTDVGTTASVTRQYLNHFNVHALGDPREAARWSNALQAVAERTPHGIPVTVSTDPRHGFTQNAGVSFKASYFSLWPEAMGLAALDDVDTVRQFAEVARQEYCAVGIRSALHPQIDLATEPRWGRQAQTFGPDAERVAEYTRAYLEGFQGPELGTASVSCITKHFPGGGPQRDGEDPHFPYGREQDYPAGRFDYHLVPFVAAIDAGTAGLMPYYGMPVGLVVDGEAIEEVGFGFNKQILTGLLRTRLGFDGVICTDWGLVTPMHAMGLSLPARAWGVEHLDAKQRVQKIIEAGADQFGGESCTDLVLALVAEGRVSEARIDKSARRLLLQKFELGLFDDPYVDEDVAAATVGRQDFRDAGFHAQAASVTVLENREVGGRPLLPLAKGVKVYLEGIAADEAESFGDVVATPAEADVIVVRLETPYSPRGDLFLESFFRAGTLEFPPGLPHRLRALAEHAPVVVDVQLSRPAILTPLVEVATALVANYGSTPPALAAALFGDIEPVGTLPFEIPRSTKAIEASLVDEPNDTVDPVYPARYGLRYRSLDA